MTTGRRHAGSETQADDTDVTCATTACAAVSHQLPQGPGTRTAHLDHQTTAGVEISPKSAFHQPSAAWTELPPQPGAEETSLEPSSTLKVTQGHLET